MTAQKAEELHYKGECYGMCSNPLSIYFSLADIEPNLKRTTTALWRRYVGTWEIIDERLYLVGLRGTLMDGTKISVSTFFPDYPERVFAHWFSGKIRIPLGKCVEYVHMGYGSNYEKDWFLTVDKGVITKNEVKDNALSIDPDAPEG
jgi:hypothetical protein